MDSICLLLRVVLYSFQKGRLLGWFDGNLISACLKFTQLSYLDGVRKGFSAGKCPVSTGQGTKVFSALIRYLLLIASLWATTLSRAKKMFISFKLVMVCLVHFYRKFKFLIPGMKGIKGEIESTTYYVSKISSKKSVWSTTLRFPFQSQTIFKLSPERKIDGLFKKLGLSKEFQTGDSEFDRKIYIACDSFSFNKSLTENVEVKEIILDLLVYDLKFISCDGELISINVKGDMGEDQRFISLGHQLVQKLSHVKESWVRENRDVYFGKMILIEVLLWSIATYAAMEIWELWAADRRVYVDLLPLVKSGVICGVIGGFLFTLMVFYQMRGSSRSHRIIIESVIVILCSFPIAGIAILSDLNLYFDRSPSEFVETKIVAKFSQRYIHYSRGSSRVRRKRVTYTHHLRIQQQPLAYGGNLPSNIEIDYRLYQLVSVNQEIVIEIGQGRFHFPWYRSIKHKI